jgi:hypothetical protein
MSDIKRCRDCTKPYLMMTPIGTPLAYYLWCKEHEKMVYPDPRTECNEFTKPKRAPVVRLNTGFYPRRWV